MYTIVISPSCKESWAGWWWWRNTQTSSMGEARDESDCWQWTKEWKSLAKRKRNGWSGSLNFLTSELFLWAESTLWLLKLEDEWYCHAPGLVNVQRNPMCRVDTPKAVKIGGHWTPGVLQNFHNRMNVIWGATKFLTWIYSTLNCNYKSDFYEQLFIYYLLLRFVSCLSSHREPKAVHSNLMMKYPKNF